MKSNTVYFNSLTHALKIKNKLSRIGLEAKVMKFSDAKKNDGCGYGLSFFDKDYFSVVKALKDSKLPYSFKKYDLP